MPTEPARDAQTPRSSAAVAVILAIVTLLAIGTCGGLVLILGLPAFQAVREARARARVEKNMQQIKMALEQYQSRMRGAAMQLEQQIKLLSDCGIPLNEGVTVDDLLYSWGREEYEGQPFELLLITMGGELESRLTAREPDERGTSFASDHIWHFDTECIEGPGSYVRIAERMAVLADGDLPLENIADSVDLEQEVAWLSFTLDD